MGDYTEHLISVAGGGGDELEELDLDAIQTRADAATVGPWEIVAGSLHQPIIYSDSSGLDIAIMDNRDGVDSDAKFIANARTDVPALLALVREQAANLEAAERAWDEDHFESLGCDSSCCNFMHDAPKSDMNPIRAALTATDQS